MQEEEIGHRTSYYKLALHRSIYTYSRENLSQSKLLKSKNIPLRLKTMVIKENFKEFKAMKDLAEKLNLKFRFDSLVHPRLDGSKLPCNQRLSVQEVVDLDLMDDKRINEFKNSYEEFKPAGNYDFVYNCGAGVDMFHINPYGKLQVCQMVTSPCINLREYTFDYGFREFFPKVRSIKKQDKSPCDGCKKQPLCARCVKWSELESGSTEAKVEYLCEIANLREQVFGLKKEESTYESGV